MPSTGLYVGDLKIFNMVVCLDNFSSGTVIQIKKSNTNGKPKWISI